MADIRQFNKMGNVPPHIVTAAEETATEVVFTTTDVDLVPTKDIAFTCQVRRLGVEIPGFSVIYVPATALLTVANAGAAVLTEDDVIYLPFAWSNG